MEEINQFQCGSCGVMSNNKELLNAHFESCKGGEIMEAQKIVNINRNERANSFEFRYGGPNTSIKLYFETAEDLENQLIALTERGASIKRQVDVIRHSMKEKEEVK